MLSLCLVSGSRQSTFKWWPKEKLLRLLFAEPGTMEVAVFAGLQDPCHPLPLQPCSRSLKVSPTQTSLWGMTVCIVSPSSFIPDLRENKSYVVISSRHELRAKTEPAAPGDTDRMHVRTGHKSEVGDDPGSEPRRP